MSVVDVLSLDIRAATSRASTRRGRARQQCGVPALQRSACGSETELAADVLGGVADPALGDLARVDAVLLELVGVLVRIDRVRKVLRDRLGLLALTVLVEEVHDLALLNLHGSLVTHPVKAQTAVV